MFVQAKWLSPNSIFADEEDVLKRMSAAWAVKSNFLETLRMSLQGDTVRFRSGAELLVIGGRKSIREAFADDPAREWQFVQAPGQWLYITARRKTHKMGKVLSLLPGVGLKMLTNKSARSGWFLDKMGKLLDVHTKTYTLLHIVSKPAEPGGFAIPPSSGAQLSLTLKRYFEEEM